MHVDFATSSTSAHSLTTPLEALKSIYAENKSERTIS
jgi:hypothetical protein